jgi:hypothetical protein
MDNAGFALEFEADAVDPEQSPGEDFQCRMELGQSLHGFAWVPLAFASYLACAL